MMDNHLECILFHESTILRRLDEIGGEIARDYEGKALTVRPDDVAFTIADAFVVGYGLDYGGRHRNLPFVGTLKREHILEGTAEGRTSW